MASILSFTLVNPRVRTTVFPILLLWTWATLPRSRNGVSRNVWASFLASNLLGQYLQYADMALLSHWSYEADGPTSTLGGQRNLKFEASGKHVSTMGKIQFGLSRHMGSAPGESAMGGKEHFALPCCKSHLCPFPSQIPARDTALKLTACIIIDIVNLVSAKLSHKMPLSSPMPGYLCLLDSGTFRVRKPLSEPVILCLVGSSFIAFWKPYTTRSPLFLWRWCLRA